MQTIPLARYEMTQSDVHIRRGKAQAITPCPSFMHMQQYLGHAIRLVFGAMISCAKNVNRERKVEPPEDCKSRDIISEYNHPGAFDNKELQWVPLISEATHTL